MRTRRDQLVNFDLGLKVCKVKEKGLFIYLFISFHFPFSSKVMGKESKFTKILCVAHLI